MAFTPLLDPTQKRKRPTHAGGMTAMARAIKQGAAGRSQASSSKPLPRPRPPPPVEVKPDPSTTNPSTPQPGSDVKEGGYTEFMIFSSAPTDHKFSILTFKPPNSSTVVAFPDQFQQPIKLNRKQPKSMLYAPPANNGGDSFVPIKPLLGPDGKAVYGPEGKIIMLNAEGLTAASFAKMSAKQAKGKGKPGADGGAAKKKVNNKPKTRQTFKASDETRQKRKEEYHPWVMEDASAKQEWIGRMDSKNDDNLWALLMVDSNTGKFQFRPVHRFYNFVDRRQYVASQRADDVNEAFTKKKPLDIVSEFTRRGGGSRATMALAQRAERDNARSNVKVKTEASGDLFGDDEETKPDLGGEGQDDEMEWEDDMADDDEGHQHEEMAADEDEKETKERQKREYKAANKPRDGHVDASDDDDDFLDDLLSGEGKRMKDSLKKLNKEYDNDSDDEDDPYGKKYGGAVKEEEPEPENILVGVRQQSLPPKITVNGTNGLPAKPKPTTSAPPLPSGPIIAPPRSGSIKPGSRATSPVPGAGQALVAMRATSPHRPISRATSPLAPGSANRAASPNHKAVGGAGTPGRSNASPSHVHIDKKRKSPFDDVSPVASSSTSGGVSKASGSGGGDSKPPKKKIHRTDVPEPTTEVLISFLKSMPNYTASSGQVSDRFGGKMWKERLLKLLKPLVDLGQGAGARTVTLKPQFR